MINLPLVNKGQARFGLVEIDETHAVCKEGNKGKMTCEEKETLGSEAQQSHAEVYGCLSNFFS